MKLYLLQAIDADDPASFTMIANDKDDARRRLTLHCIDTDWLDEDKTSCDEVLGFEL